MSKYYALLPSEMEEIYEESGESDQTVNTAGGGSLFKFRRHSSKIVFSGPVHRKLTDHD